jgi:UPF0755 protein
MRWSRMIAVLLIVFGVLGGSVYLTFLAPNYFADRTHWKTIFIPRGATFADIADSLHQNGVVRRKFCFVLAGKLLGWAEKIRAGKYLLLNGASNFEILRDLHTGRSAMNITITLVEGQTARSYAHILAREVGIDPERFMALVHDSTFAHELGIDASSLEGYLFPNTYEFYWQEDEEAIIRRLVETFKHFYNDSLQEQARKLGLTTEQVVTLASIVDAEAEVDSERSIIAGVYLNRLHRGMRLEADPTVQYALGKQGRVYWKDLDVESPYNTYLYAGLPPGPINNPGMRSIKAVLYPSRHEYLFLVSNGHGGHVFSRTYKEHQRAVQKYRKIRERQIRRENAMR